MFRVGDVADRKSETFEVKDDGFFFFGSFCFWKIVGVELHGEKESHFVSPLETASAKVQFSWCKCF